MCGFGFAFEQTQKICQGGKEEGLFFAIGKKQYFHLYKLAANKGDRGAERLCSCGVYVALQQDVFQR